MAIATREQVRSAPRPDSGRRWCPHIWTGCTLGAWLRLLAAGGFGVGWRYWYVAAIVTVLSVIHSILRLMQQIIYGRRIRQTPLRQPPIIIIGHWRTGTTFLHELLVQDERHTSPTSYECFEPNHFLLTQKLITKALWFLPPTKRPMDNVATGWEHPQEDEFALCIMGKPSPYRRIAFPNSITGEEDGLDLDQLSPAARQEWKDALMDFLQTVSLRRRKRLVLKSPPHTCRIKVLKEMFPNAVFIHIVRNPYVVFPSTVNLWKSLYSQQSLQTPHLNGLEEYVFETFSRMHAKLEATRHLVDDDHFYQLRYEDLVRDPVREMRALYDHLGLGEFDELRPRLDNYLASVAGYETNRYELKPEMRRRIRQRWGEIIKRYGYDQ